MIDWQTFFGLWKIQEITGNVFGTLVDVSGSMGQITGGQINVHGGKWAKSIFQVIDDLIKNDISSENKVFALAFGANRDKGTFDILSTLEKVQDYVATIDEMKKYSKQKIVEEILQKLEENGAKHIRKWADIQTIYNAIGIDDACTLLHELRQSNYVCRDIVDNCLPSNCKDWGNNDSIVSNLFESMFTSAVTTFRQASPEEVRAAMEKAKVRVKSEFELIEQLRTFSIHNARKIVHGVKGDTEMTDQRANELLKRIEPFIYGGTPLYGSLKDAASLFSRCVISTKYSKILVVVSDGEPSDYGNALEFAKQFEDLKTTVVSCFITNTEDIEPRRLYSSKQHEWSDGANLLFDLCSPIPSQMVPRTILLKQNWDIDIEDNETKLFLQVNDPENVHDICDLAYNAVCSHDSLAELLVSASLDISIYMNASPTRMTPADQRSEPVCYAIASSATIHLAMKRILGRHDGYPEFSDLYKEMVARHGPNLTNTFQVLIETCPYYRLRCDDDIGVFGALEAIRERRPVVAIFKLTNTEWKSFRRFFLKKTQKKY